MKAFLHSPAELGFAGENLSLQPCNVGAFGVVSFLKASRGFGAPHCCSVSCCVAMVVLEVVSLVVLGSNVLGWLPELVVFASCGVL